MTNQNILSQRYATKHINEIFSERGRAIAERELWISVMKAQKKLGLNIPSEDIEKFEKAKDDINLKSIERIEKDTKHDVKAKIKEFIRVSGAREHIHKGMTSRDLSDNVEQMQIRKASDIILDKYVSILRHFGEKAREYQNIVLTARTHHQPAQPTLLGRRFSMWAEELINHLGGFESYLEELPLRGIKGPIGTQFDMLTLLGNEKKVEILERDVAKSLGFNKTLNSIGQVYPRSLDYELISNLALLSSACENFAKNIRLMAGYELLTEGFKEGQVGSSAMPHKMNTRSTERICGFSELLKMYADGASRLLGDQWEEGDVSDSVVRRVIIPDSFYTSDGLCETTLTVLNDMEVYPAVIDKETDRYLPFLATTEILMEAIKSGIGRETAHDLIKKHAVSEALRMRQEGSKRNNLASLLANESSFAKAGITEKRINDILSDKIHFIGNAQKQIRRVCKDIDRITSLYQIASRYEPGDIL